MPKKKKTLKHKMLADTRREQEIQALYSYEAPRGTDREMKASRAIKSTAVSTINFQYLASDLRKTLFFTSLVVLIEVTLSYFL